MPMKTGHDLLRKLQAAYPNTYSSGLLRTVQGSLKVWRGNMVRELVFGVSPHATPLLACDALRNVKASRLTGQQVSSGRKQEPLGIIQLRQRHE